MMNIRKNIKNVMLCASFLAMPALLLAAPDNEAPAEVAFDNQTGLSVSGLQIIWESAKGKYNQDLAQGYSVIKPLSNQFRVAINTLANKYRLASNKQQPIMPSQLISLKPTVKKYKITSNRFPSRKLPQLDAHQQSEIEKWGQKEKTFVEILTVEEMP
jgi:hypothetical protein